MAENTLISWCTHTVNFWWGCTKVGPGCDHCYAETFDRRVGGDHWGPGKPRRLVKDWSKPRKWQREAERTGVRPWVFAQSMSDIFDNEVPLDWRDRAWQLVRDTPLLRWIFVTKRIGNAAKMLPPDWPQAFAHCGLVITVVNQTEADRDIPKLLATPAAWRGLSMEPLLGPVEMGWALSRNRAKIAAGFLARGHFAPGPEKLRPLDWVIVGGESGHRARPMHPAWARSLRDQCASAGVPFHFKQWGEFAPEGLNRERWLWRPDGTCIPDPLPEGIGRHSKPEFSVSYRVGKTRAGRLLDGVEHNGMPGDPEPRR